MPNFVAKDKMSRSRASHRVECTAASERVAVMGRREVGCRRADLKLSAVSGFVVLTLLEERRLEQDESFNTIGCFVERASERAGGGAPT
jgi:hypothetical protein